MKFNKIILSEDVTRKLQMLKGKTGLTPNILCRFGFMLSLQDTTVPDPLLYKQNGQELQRYVLLGEHDAIYIALFKQKAYEAKMNLNDEKALIDCFRAHMNRGAELLYNRKTSISEIY